MMLMVCVIDGCAKRRHGGGLCQMHYTRKLRTGDPLATKVPAPIDRLWSYVQKSDTCWVWTGPVDATGYGIFNADGRGRVAHRVVYELVIGPVPNGIQLDHLCHDANICKKGPRCPHRRCVNPSHLEPVTPAVNTSRATNYWRDRTHCKNGHEFTDDNVYLWRNSRRCRACHRKRQSAINARRSRAA